MKILTEPDRHADHYGIILEPHEYEALEEALNVDIRASFHVDHWNDPGDTHDNWADSAAEVVEKSDYDILTESVSLTKTGEL